MDKFYGSGLTPRDYELRSLRIDPVHREGEADLVRSRWFDYARLHPAEATYLYAHLYQKQTRVFCETYVDIRSAQDARGFVPDDIFMSRDATSMWLARRCADSLGLPYDFVLSFGMQRAVNRLFKAMPRPNQLYGEEFEIDLKAEWEASLARSLRYSRQPQFKASAFVGSLVQKAHETFLVEQIKRRPAPHHNLLARMFTEDMLSPQRVVDHFPEAVIARAVGVSHR